MKKRASPKKKAKELIKYLKKEKPDYNYMRELFRHMRKELDLKRVVQPQTPPYVPSEEEIKEYYKAVWKSENIFHMILIKTLIYTGIRVSEIIHVKLKDIDLRKCQISVFDKKKKDVRLVLFPVSFKETLQAYIKQYRKDNRTYLFESSFQRNYSDRGIRVILTSYTEQAGMRRSVSPRQLRSFLLTWLKNQGIENTLIQPYSGHTKEKSLDLYSNSSLGNAKREYRKAMSQFPI